MIRFLVFLASFVMCTSFAQTLSGADQKKLLKEFSQSYQTQRASLLQQEKAALKDLTKSQNQNRKKWIEEQRVARHRYFDTHMSGSERREYVQTYLRNKEKFEQDQKSEMSDLRKSWSEKITQFNTLHKENDHKFKEYLKQGQQPPADLWPAPAQ